MVPARLRPVAAVALAALIGSALQPAASSAQPRDLGAAVAPIRLIARGPHPISVGGLHSYLGAVKIDAAPDGLVVSNRLGLERYLLGLSEVPSNWPMEALKAQAVAARTYALFTLGEPRYGAAATYGFDICASVLCQVFAGADKIAEADGLRWAEAVAATEGEAVLYGGSPILARYHSTSGGRTLSNPEGFPGERDYPYLRAVESPYEQPAPLDRWTVRFTVGQIEAMLERAGRWTKADGRLTAASTRSSTGHPVDPEVTFHSAKKTVRLPASEVRELFGRLAPTMFGGRYPSFGPTASGRLPETLPSHRVEVSTRGRKVVFAGRGWGHGVGMSQWGAHGFAERGATYLQILQHYYRSVQVRAVPTPSAIEVGVGWGLPSVAATGSFEVVDGRGRTLVRRALGTWRFSWVDDGIVAIDPPKGYGLPLNVGVAEAPRTVEVGEAVFITVALSRPAKVRTKTFGSPTGYRDPGVQIAHAGKERIPWLAPIEPGVYRVIVRAVAGSTVRRTEPIMIAVEADPSDEPAAPAVSDDGSGSGLGRWMLAGLIALLLLAVGGGIALDRMNK